MMDPEVDEVESGAGRYAASKVDRENSEDSSMTPSTE